jgi:hypothetical protein
VALHVLDMVVRLVLWERFLGGQFSYVRCRCDNVLDVLPMGWSKKFLDMMFNLFFIFGDLLSPSFDWLFLLLIPVLIYCFISLVF